MTVTLGQSLTAIDAFSSPQEKANYAPAGT